MCTNYVDITVIFVLVYVTMATNRGKQVSREDLLLPRAQERIFTHPLLLPESWQW